ncbi:MAG: rRNA maturation RNase YbeY [Verrucomicrobiae bacterium]|nr:rRNA maturation RNase YbeY [Verrucomicrobiae bacterium]
MNASRPVIAIAITNSQRVRPVPRAAVRRLVADYLASEGLEADLAIHFISARRSAALNQRHLQHEGPTDILTFDLGGSGRRLRGELFICVAEAVRQAPLFGATWREELFRYVLHGLLHLQGHDDQDPARRRVMKRAENRLMARWVSRRSAPRRASR